MLKSNTAQKGFFGGLLALSIALTISGNSPAYSADEGSLDSMWMDQGSKPAAQPSDAQPQTSAPRNTVMMRTEPAPDPNDTAPTDITPAETPTTTYARPSLSPTVETAAPMCSLTEFKNSALVSKGGWPGVGPFKPEDAGNEFSDDHNNRVKVDVSAEKITRAEMTLAAKKLSGNQQKALLDMQMNVDFLLEAVGLKAKKIEDFNREMDKNKDALLKADKAPLSLVTGRYSVNIEKRPSSAGSGIDYTVVVNSLDANKKIIKEHSQTEAAKPPATTPDARYIYKDPAPSDSSDVKPTKISARPQVKTPGGEKATSAIVGIGKEQFAAVIGDWQKVKRGAVKTRQTEELATILSGKALARQMDAIKWLVTNKKFYEMNPKGVVVDQYTEILPNRKYAVMAQVREAYKFIDEPTGKVLKEVDDINHVNYTIEKVGGKWLITDSSLLAPAKSASGKSAATTGKTH